MVDAAASLLEIKNTTSEAVRAYSFMTDWLAGEFWHCERRVIVEFPVRPHKPMRIDAGSKWRRGIKGGEI